MKNRGRYLPFLLSFFIVILDQVSKELIIRNISENTVGFRILGDFLWIVHVRNNAVAFSLGENVPVFMKYVLFVALPVLIMILVAWMIASHRTDGEFTRFQKWCLAGILGGGVGNLIDRIFRSLRVVDFISVKFYGLFGLKRFPTWNIADSAVVISVGLLIISMIVTSVRDREKEKDE